VPARSACGPCMPAWTAGFSACWLGIESVVYPGLKASLGARWNAHRGVGCAGDCVRCGSGPGVIRFVNRQTAWSTPTNSMIESSLDSLVAISPQGKITDANQATVKLTGVPREHLIGTSFSDYFTEPAKAEAIYQKVFTEGMAVDYPLTLRHRDGHETLTEVLYNASVYRDTAGNVLGVFAAARDVTEQMRAQREGAERLA
jgi:PAS domain S-box-containing protein